MVTRTVRMSSFSFNSEGRKGKVKPRNRRWGRGGGELWNLLSYTGRLCKCSNSFIARYLNELTGQWVQPVIKLISRRFRSSCESFLRRTESFASTDQQLAKDLRHLLNNYDSRIRPNYTGKHLNYFFSVNSKASMLCLYFHSMIERCLA